MTTSERLQDLISRMLYINGISMRDTELVRFEGRFGSPYVVFVCKKSNQFDITVSRPHRYDDQYDYISFDADLNQTKWNFTMTHCDDILPKGYIVEFPNVLQSVTEVLMKYGFVHARASFYTNKNGSWSPLRAWMRWLAWTW